MIPTPHCPDVRVVCTDFQAKPSAEYALSREEALAIATEAFPRTLPPNVRASGTYRALKVFPAGPCVAVSHVFDGGAVDEWDRPLLSARVALFRPAPRNGWGREIAAAGQALSLLERQRGGTRAAARAVAQSVAAHGILSARERFAEAAAPYGIAFLARVAHACATGTDVVFAGTDDPGTRQLLTLALALLPPARFEAVRVCTACAHPDSDTREEIVCFPAPTPGPRRLLTRLTGRPGPGDRIVIDPAARSAPAIRGGRLKPGAFAAALTELLEAPPWPLLSFPETHQLLLHCLQAIWTGQPEALLDSARSALPEEICQRIQHFLRKACAG